MKKTPMLYFANMIQRYYHIRCFNHLKLFEITKAEDIVENWFCLLQEKYNCTVLYYHLHPDSLEFVLLIEKNTLVKKIIANGKRFMAYEIVFRLHDKQKHQIIDHLKNALSRSEIKKGQLHKVFVSNGQGLTKHLYKLLEQIIKMKKAI